MRVVGLSGSLRGDSYNRKLLLAAARELAGDVAFEEFGSLARVPPYNEEVDRDPAPASVTDLRRSLERADALIVATPEYNASIPGQLKNVIDWASRPSRDNSLRGKPAIVIGASTGLFGAVWAQAELRKVLDHIGARVVDGDLPVGQAHEAFAPDGSLRSPELRQGLSALVAELMQDAWAPVRRAA